jgi:hypothetical protein
LIAGRQTSYRRIAEVSVNSIKLEKDVERQDKIVLYGPLCGISREKPIILRRTLNDNLDKNFIRVSVHAIHGAYVTRTMLEYVTQHVFDRKGYNVITNNSQHFCLDVVKELNRHYPDFVSVEAVEDVRQRTHTRTRQNLWKT